MARPEEPDFQPALVTEPDRGAMDRLPPAARMGGSTAKAVHPGVGPAAGDWHVFSDGGDPGDWSLQYASVRNLPSHGHPTRLGRLDQNTLCRIQGDSPLAIDVDLEVLCGLGGIHDLQVEHIFDLATTCNMGQ